MQTQKFIPSESIIHLIKEFRYATVRGEESGMNDHVIIDDGCYDFIFYKGDNASFSYGVKQTIEISNGAFTIHQLKPPFRLNLGKEFKIFVVKVQPWANTIFFAESLKPGIINLEEQYGEKIVKLGEAIFELDEPKEMQILFEYFVASIEIEKSDTYNIIKGVCEEIYHSNGGVKVNDLVDQFSINRQLLNKKFKKQVHYTIKQFIMIVRIVSAVKHRIENPEVSLTSLAHHFHYTDQAHFNNDFRKVCGISPSSFFKDLPIFLNRNGK